MNLLERFHEYHIVGRRARVLSRAMASFLPPSATVLDVGCGDGLIASLVMAERPDVRLTGIDVLARPNASIPVQVFDGRTIPFSAGSFTAVILVDVLHHAVEPTALLGEAARVAADIVVIKDHKRDGPLASATLRFMDRVGNVRHGVAVTGAYWTGSRWRAEFDRLGLRPHAWREHLGMYPFPGNLVFERSLHFFAVLEPTRRSAPQAR